MNKKVLIITYYFPPKPFVASQRFKGMAKYLPQFGWDPVFITTALPGPVDPNFRVYQVPEPLNIFKRFKKKMGWDPEIKIQEHIKVPVSMRQGKKSFINKLELFIRSIVLYPNKNKGWCPLVIKQAQDLLKNEKFDAVISSSPLFMTHLIAKEIKNTSNLPWLADFRDLWTLGNFYDKGFIIKFFERNLKIKTLSTADAISIVSQPWAEKLGKLIKAKDYFVIPNGFDPDDSGTAPLTKEFTITYTGLLHADNQDPTLLFAAARQLIDEGKIDPALIQIRFYGQSQYWLDQDIKTYNLQAIVKQYGIIPREQALLKQRESQLLWTLDWQDPKEVGFHTAKIFEYLQAHRPILATGGGQGVIKDLLKETNAGKHASDVTAIKKTLLEYYLEYKNTGNISYFGIQQEIDKYSRVQMAEKFASALNSVTGKK